MSNRLEDKIQNLEKIATEHPSGKLPLAIISLAKAIIGLREAQGLIAKQVDKNTEALQAIAEALELEGV